MKELLQEAQGLFGYTQATRRDLHRHPELGFQEVRTAAVVARELEAIGLDVTTGIAKTGVVGLLSGSKPGPTVLLRFDMDALPIHEETAAPYASEIPGVMHACGHDGHTSIGLTIAKLLQSHRADVSGSIKFCFQPCEESLGEEGLGGNEMMIREGVLESPGVDRTLTLHLWNEKPIGWMGIAGGPVMAGAEEFSIKIQGKGGHGASPHLTADPIVTASQLVLALQTITSRNVAPLDAAVISVTTIHSGTAFNIIPQTAELTGTIRTFEPAVRQRVLDRLAQVAKGTAEAMGCIAQLASKQVTPALINDVDLARRAQAVAQTLLPEGELDASGHFTMGAEDMAFMQQKVPGCYLLVGSNNAEKNFNYAHHHPKFDFDEAALPGAAALMSAIALDFLAAD